MMIRTLALFAVPAFLAGCQSWGPTWSEVTGERFHRTEMNRAPTIIERIDGSGAAAGGHPPHRIEPGRRVLTLQGVPLVVGWSGTRQDFVLNAEPCKRYYVNAQFRGRLVPSDWEPVIDEVETIGSCRVDGAK